MKNFLSIYIIVLFACLAIGCSTTSDRRNVGMVAGGVVGGVAGSAITGGSTAGTIVGAVGGGLVGRSVAN